MKLIAASLILTGLALGQQPPKLSFEVVSVKPAAGQQMNQLKMMKSSDPGRVRYSSFSLRDYIRIAFGVKDFQVEGPEWIDSARFDVEGKLPEGAGEDRVPEMLQSMLADRFKLTVHRDSKEHAVFALVAGKAGPKLKVSDAPAPEPTGGPAAGRGGVPRGGMRIQVDEKGAHVNANGVTLSQLAEMVSRFSERPVVDMSGITGTYDFDLVLSPENLRGGHGMGMMGPGPEGGHAPSDAAAEGPGTVHEAVQAYGLKLEPRKAQMETVVVDHIEKSPIEN